MSQSNETVRKRLEWRRPELKRLGTIADVAGAQTPVAQGNGAKS